MSKKRQIDTRFWNDSWIVDQLNPLDRYLLQYLLTNDKTNLSGIFEIPARIIANETGLDRDEVERMLRRLEPKVFYKNGWVVIVNMIKHQNYKNKSIAAGVQRELCNAPEELIELLKIPKDFDMDFSCPVPIKRTRGVREGYERGTTTEEPNLTKPNLTLLEPNLTKPKRDLANACREVFDFYNQIFGTEYLYTEGRRNKIKLRLKTFSKEQIKKAFDNAQTDDFFNGGGERGWQGNLDYLLRNDENLEKYLKLNKAVKFSEKDVKKYV